MNNPIKAFQKVYQMLEDEESRFTYLNRLNYLISGEFKYIDDIVKKYLPELPAWGSKTIEQLLSALPEDKKFVLFGAGDTGTAVLHLVQKDPRFYGFCSSTAEKQEQGFLGYPVMSPRELLSRKDISVIISAIASKSEILQLLQQEGYPEELIFPLNLPHIDTNNQYFGPNFIKFEKEEVFVDAGSFDLGNALALRNYCNHVKRVYAFEPDPGNHKICQHNKERDSFVEAEIFPYGTWSEEKTLHFNANKENSASSQISNRGEISVPVRAIDEVVTSEDRVTFIKMDVEGAELESLKGAKDTIQRDKPKLAICIYHKAEDMIEIPLYIKMLVPEYKFYIRHHSNYIYETVLYAVIS